MIKINLEKITLILASMMVLLIFSCSKDGENYQDDLTVEEVQTSVRTKVLDHPIGVNGRYEFRDPTHFFDYLKDLQDVFDTDYEQFRFEASQDFQNPDRDATITTVYQKMSNDVFVNPNDRYMTYLYDPVIQSIVNLDYEIKVGSTLLTYLNNSQILMSDPTDLTSLTAIRNLTGGEVIGLSKVPDDVTWANDENVEALLFGSCKCKIYIEKTDCNTVRVYGSCKDLIWGKGDATITMTLTPNGSTPIVRTEQINGNFEFLFDISNFTSSVFFNVSADPDCIFGKTAFASFGMTPNQSVCDFEERATPWSWKQDSGSQAISYQTRYHRNYWAGYEQAQIYSYHFNGTSWSNNKSNLRVSIDATRKSLVCVVQNNEDETKSCTHCKDKQASVNSLYYWHCDGDVVGSFRKLLNWNGSTWTINDTQDVNFDCCE